LSNIKSGIFDTAYPISENKLTLIKDQHKWSKHIGEITNEVKLDKELRQINVDSGYYFKTFKITPLKLLLNFSTKPIELDPEETEDDEIEEEQENKSFLNFKDLGLSIANIKDADINLSSVNLKNTFTT